MPYDPCAGIAPIAAASPTPTAIEHDAVVRGFLVCARKVILETVRPASEAFQFFKIFSNGPAGDHSSPPTLRKSFSDDDLVELRRLSLLRKSGHEEAQKKIFAALALRRNSLEKKAPTIARLRGLLTLSNFVYSLDVEPNDVAIAFARALESANILPARTVSEVPSSLLYPYAFLTLALTAPGSEMAELTEEQNPFVYLDDLRTDLAGQDTWIEGVTRYYAHFRDLDNPGWEAETKPAPTKVTETPVRVAVLDSGFDYVQFPEIARYLSKNGSYDFGDDDSDPYLPALGTHGHGTGTAATLLTLLAHYSPALLLQDRFQLLGWKYATLRSFLGGPPGFDSDTWINHPEAVVAPAISASLALKDPSSNIDLAIFPDVVSVSLNFQTLPWIRDLKDSELLNRLPWLWVMAAGNFGVDVATTENACFLDLDEATRPSDSTVCVGALTRGILDDRIAGYSNFGDQVDVYTYDQFIQHCPSGTSCATPAIAFLAAQVKAARPELRSSDIKSILLTSATLRELPVEAPAGKLPVTRVVRVLDPTTDLPHILAETKKFKIQKKEGIQKK